MCRNITELRGLEPHATTAEIEAAARQYVRKVSGLHTVTDATREPFENAVADIAAITTHLLERLPGPPSAAAHRAAAAPTRGPGADGGGRRPGMTRHPAGTASPRYRGSDGCHTAC